MEFNIVLSSRTWFCCLVSRLHCSDTISLIFRVDFLLPVSWLVVFNYFVLGVVQVYHKEAVNPVAASPHNWMWCFLLRFNK